MRKLNVKKIILVILVIIVLTLISALGYFIFKKNKMKSDILIKIKLEKNLTAEVNTEVNMLSFIKEVKNGTILVSDSPIDTSKLGPQKLVIPISYGTVIYNYNFNIEIVDTIEPVITSEEVISTTVGSNIDLTKVAKVTDNSNEEVKVEIEGKYDINKEGSYNLVFVATDSSGNKARKDFVLKVNTDPNNRTLTTSKGYTLKIINGVAYIDDVLIANKTYTLPSNYGSGLTTETLNNFYTMQSAASIDGINIYIISGFRSYYDQQYLYNNYVNRDGKAAADRYSARPGHSEHQSGLAFDLNSVEFAFEYTNEAKWINDNCYKYGFILRYPKEKESITGYMYEPWHLRYVGKELASKLYNNGNWITLEEYFGIDSKC